LRVLFFAVPRKASGQDGVSRQQLSSRYKLLMLSPGVDEFVRWIAGGAFPKMVRERSTFDWGAEKIAGHDWRSRHLLLAVG
jgi:hypothetical protein